MGHVNLLLVSSCQKKNQKALYQLRVFGLKTSRASSYSTSFYECGQYTVNHTGSAFHMTCTFSVLTK